MQIHSADSFQNFIRLGWPKKATHIFSHFASPRFRATQRRPPIPRPHLASDRQAQGMFSTKTVVQRGAGIRVNHFTRKRKKRASPLAALARHAGPAARQRSGRLGEERCEFNTQIVVICCASYFAARERQAIINHLHTSENGSSSLH